MRRTSEGRKRGTDAARGLLLLAFGATAAIAAPSAEGVSPARGPSLIARLKTGVDWTAFGRAGEGEAVGAPTAHASGRPAGVWLTQGFELSGADLFRLNCRACHGPEGKGARSGIPPLGGALEKAPAESGAMGGEIRVRHRLVEGGRVMPNFVHLDAEETNLLIAHLRTLGKPAGGATAPAKTLRQSALRVGEHVVKATCQVCHDAAAGPERMPADAAVPTIAEFTAKYSVGDFLRKTRAGSPEAGAAHGRMPRFGYLTTEELEAAYVYLIAFPPEPGPK